MLVRVAVGVTTEEGPRLRGGGWRDIEPSERALVPRLAVEVMGRSFTANCNGCRSGMILRSMPISGVTDDRNGELVRTIVAPLDCDWTSGVVARSMLIRLLPMLLNASSPPLESWRSCLVVSTDVAREVERGRDPENRLLKAETVVATLGAEACD